MQNEPMAKETTLRDYIRVLFRHKAVILTTFITVMLTVFIGLKLKTPVYEARVKMLISAEKQVESPYYRDIMGSRNAEITLTQSEIVMSDPVIKRAVAALKLNEQPLDYEKQFSSVLKAKLIDYNVKKFEKALAKNTEKQKKLAFSQWEKMGHPVEEFEKKFAEISEQQKANTLFRQAIEKLKKSITVVPIRDTNLFTINVKDFSPIGATIMANVVSRSYVIFDLEQQQTELTLKYGAKHPAVTQLKDNIESMKANLTGKLLTDLEALGPASVKIIEQANIPLKPTGTPKFLTFALALFMSGFLGIMLAFVFEYMDQTFKSPQDIEQTLNLPFLGSIPKKNLSQNLLIKNMDKRSTYTHFYQVLSDQMYLLMKDKKLKSFLITSTESQEGTSAIIANLGTYLAKKANCKVLLIDANLRNPFLDKIFKLKPAAGLIDMLEDKVSLEEAVCKTDTLLHVLTAGKTELNPVILLDSSKMVKIIEDAKKKYGIVFLDCPNLTSFKDAVVLSSYVDGIALVINEGISRRQVVKNAIASLEQKDGKLIGVILNNRTFAIPRFIYNRV